MNAPAIKLFLAVLSLVYFGSTPRYQGQHHDGASRWGFEIGIQPSDSSNPMGQPCPAKPPLLLACPIATTSSRRRIRIVIYARFSTDQQSPRSIGDQVAMCRKHLETMGLEDAELILLNDEALSGEHAHRPGIDQVWELIESGGCDVIVAEDLSRLYRNSTQAMGLIEAAVDAGVRVIAINSHIDTNEDEERWRMGSHFASMKAEMDNAETRKRIVRAMEGLWRDGYAVGAVKPGYVRVPTVPPTDREPAKGPFRDQKDARWTPVIEHAFQTCASNNMPWVIAQYLTESGFPKSARSRVPQWTEANVIRLIRDPIYYGVEAYRKRRSVKKYKLGKSVQVPSPDDEILYRDMPHLAHLPKSLWDAANRAIDQRNVNTNPSSGNGNPLHSSNRNSRTALSEFFFCGVCDAKMYRQGNIYRCANSRHPSNIYRKNGERCWNRCVLQLETVHRNLAASIVEALVAQEGCFDALCARVIQLVEQGIPEVDRRIALMRSKETELQRNCTNLTKAIEKGGDIPQLVAQLRSREKELQENKSEIDFLVERNQRQIPKPSNEEIQHLLQTIQSELLDDFDSKAAPILKRLIDGKLRAVPYHRFDGDSLHLRAHFTLNILRLLPQEWQQLLDDRTGDDSLTNIASVSSFSMAVDLFKVPKRISYAKTMAELVVGGLSIREAGNRLGLPETTANKAFRTGRAMAERGLNDAYIKVKGMPARPGRWRPHTDRPDIFETT